MFTSMRSVHRFWGASRRDAQRKHDRQRHQQRERRPDDGSPDSRELRLPRVPGAEEAPVEGRADVSPGTERLDPADLRVLQAPLGLGGVCGDPALGEHVDLVVRRQPHRHRLPDQGAVFEHHVAQQAPRAHAHQRLQRAHIAPALDRGEPLAQSPAHEGGEVHAIHGAVELGLGDAFQRT
jgi:hypothetical protein